MSKTLAAAKRQERVKFKVPRSVQDAIPIRKIWADGIFQVGNQYSISDEPGIHLLELVYGESDERNRTVNT